MYRGGLPGGRAELACGMTSTLRTAAAAGDPEALGPSTLAGPEAFNLTLAGLDQSGRGGGHGLSFFCCTAAGELPDVVVQPEVFSSESVVAPDFGSSFTSLIRLVRCSKLSRTPFVFVFVGVVGFLVGCRAVPGLGRGLWLSGGLTGSFLERAT